jgi:ATP-dependent RNA helicase HelY
MARQRVNSSRRKRDDKGKRGRTGQGRKGSDRPAPSRTERVEPQGAQGARHLSRELRRLLEGIGQPAPSPFKPDPFQLEALAALEYEDVLVTAPTGSGKTWIAREEIRRLLAAGRRAWYTSPLKALTNSKYTEFSAEFGAENVGILTGDRKENGDAPLIVGTTEIYRNQLFDSLRSGTNIRADLVVLDEAHYLADEDRGHVWEEAIILSPPRIRLLLLSATIGNAQEFAAWMEEVRGVRCGVVARPGARPVPLRAAFLYPDGILAPLLDERGGLNPEIARMVEREKAARRERDERRGGGRTWRSRRGGGGGGAR